MSSSCKPPLFEDFLKPADTEGNLQETYVLLGKMLFWRLARQSWSFMNLNVS